MTDADNVLHAFRTFLGLPPDTDTPPVCGAALKKDYDGRGKPHCQTCDDLILAERLGLTDLTPRYAPDTVICGQRYQPVTGSVFYPAGQHPHIKVIKAEYPCLELKTPEGSRYYGCIRAYINAELRMVVVGTSPHDEVRMKWQAVPKNRR